MSKFLNLDNVLCLSPHPDDVEYGMLGSIIKHEDTNFHIMVFSIGGDFDVSSNKSRQTECQVIWDKLENVTGTFLYDTHLSVLTEDELVNKIDNFNQNTRIKWDAIFCPPKEDSHFEHKMINSIVPACVRRLDCGIIDYRTPSTLENWIPNLYVEVDIEEKSELLKSFESQSNKSFFNKGPLEVFHTNYNCKKRGIDFVETYRIERLYD